jgi:hypothetical protein
VDTRNDQDIGAQIERLTKAATAQKLTIDGVEYATAPVFDPRKPEPKPETLAVSTLRSLVDYVTSMIDEEYIAERGLLLHVESPTRVVAWTHLFGPHNQRVALAVAEPTVEPPRFGEFLDPETFIIQLQSRTLDSGDRARVLSLCGCLTTEAVRTVEDDGTTQSAKVRAGVVMQAERKVPNPVLLSAFRTFQDVPQPEVPYILRLRGGGDGKPPACALFEADGGAWKARAAASIATMLKDELASMALPPDVLA